MTIDQLNEARYRLNHVLGCAVQGWAREVSAFKRLGIPAYVLLAVPPQARIGFVVRALLDVPEMSERFALAQELMGHNGPALIPRDGEAPTVIEHGITTRTSQWIAAGIAIAAIVAGGIVAVVTYGPAPVWYVVAAGALVFGALVVAPLVRDDQLDDEDRRR